MLDIFQVSESLVGLTYPKWCASRLLSSSTLVKEEVVTDQSNYDRPLWYSFVIGVFKFINFCIYNFWFFCLYECVQSILSTIDFCMTYLWSMFGVGVIYECMCSLLIIYKFLELLISWRQIKRKQKKKWMHWLLDWCKENFFARSSFVATWMMNVYVSFHLYVDSCFPQVSKT